MVALQTEDVGQTWGKPGATRSRGCRAFFGRGRGWGRLETRKWGGANREEKQIPRLARDDSRDHPHKPRARHPQSEERFSAQNTRGEEAVRTSAGGLQRQKKRGHDLSCPYESGRAGLPGENRDAKGAKARPLHKQTGERAKMTSGAVGAGTMVPAPWGAR